MLLVCPASLMSEYHCSQKATVPGASALPPSLIPPSVHPSGILAVTIPLPSSPKKSFSNKYLTISLIQRLPKKIFNFRVTFSLLLQLIIIEGNNKGTPTGIQP